MTTSLPSSAWVSVTCAPIAQFRPILTCGPITLLAPMIVPDPTSARGPMTTPGSIVTSASRRASAWMNAAGLIPRVANTDAGRRTPG